MSFATERGILPHSFPARASTWGGRIIAPLRKVAPCCANEGNAVSLHWTGGLLEDVEVGVAPSRRVGGQFLRRAASDDDRPVGRHHDCRGPAVIVGRTELARPQFFIVLRPFAHQMLPGLPRAQRRAGGSHDEDIPTRINRHIFAFVETTGSKLQTIQQLPVRGGATGDDGIAQT